MDLYDDRIKLDKFKFQTTYRNDFKYFNFAEKAFPNKTRPHCEPFRKDDSKKLLDYVDNETFQKWRPNVLIPFNLLWKPRDIIDKPIEYKFPDDEEKDKEDARKSRPRVYMLPAVSVDDINDPETRRTIMNYMYTSSAMKANRDFVTITKFKPKTIKPSADSTSKIKSESDAINFQSNLLAALPSHFRNKGKEWEHKQIRSGPDNDIDPTETFWMKKASTVRGALDDQLKNLVSEEIKNEIKTLIKTDKLRAAHDKCIPGYSGYQPCSSEGIELRKNEIDISQPILSTNQAITKHYRL